MDVVVAGFGSGLLVGGMLKGAHLDDMISWPQTFGSRREANRNGLVTF